MIFPLDFNWIDKCSCVYCNDKDSTLHAISHLFPNGTLTYVLDDIANIENTPEGLDIPNDALLKTRKALEEVRGEFEGHDYEVELNQEVDRLSNSFLDIIKGRNTRSRA